MTDSSTTVALKADNGKYLSFINVENQQVGNVDIILAVKPNIDVFSKFTFYNLGNNAIALQANNGMFLSRIRYTGGQLGFKDGDYIMPVKKGIDVFSIFTVTDIGENTIALLADNGKYVSRYSFSDDDANYVCAVKDSIDDACKFSTVLFFGNE